MVPVGMNAGAAKIFVGLAEEWLPFPQGDRLRQIEPDAKLAVLRTGAQRLRPVLLTTVTTILGLLPMVLRVNIDFVSREITHGAPSTQWWTQLATAIAFGLAFATILTLVVTPSALMMRANVRARLDRWRRRRQERKTAKSTKPAPLREAAE